MLDRIIDDERFVIWDDEETGFCYDCDEETHILAGPGHPPYNAEANYVCEAHVRHDYAILRITDDGIETIREAK